MSFDTIYRYNVYEYGYSNVIVIWLFNRGILLLYLPYC